MICRCNQCMLTGSDEDFQTHGRGSDEDFQTHGPNGYYCPQCGNPAIRLPSMSDKEKTGAIRIVGAGEFQYLHGWRVVNTLHYEELVTTNKEVMDPENRRRTFTETEHHKVRQDRLVVAEDRDCTIARLQEEIRRLSAESAQLGLERNEQARQVDSITEELRQTTEALREHRKEGQQLLRSWDNSEKLRRKLEVDLAKLRKEIGEREWNRILGES